MYGIENYTAFIIAGILLNLTPGSDTIYIITRSIAQGRKAGFYSVYGIVSGAFIHTLFAAFGLSVILATSAIAFMTIKYLGAAYLVYLGIKMLQSKGSVYSGEKQNNTIMPLAKIYGQGLATNLLNPKVALFYLAFLPQFIDTEYTHGPLSFIILGLTFMTTGTIWCLFIAYAASSMSKTLRNNSRIEKLMQKISGMVFIGLGLKLLFSKR